MLLCAFFCQLVLLSPPSGVKRIVVVAQDGSGDFNGRTEEAIVKAIEEVSRIGGGVVLIKKGIYSIRRTISLHGKKNIAIIGEPGTVLRMPPEVWSVAIAEAEVGRDFVELESTKGFEPGMKLEVQAPGRTEITPSGKKIVVPYFDVVVKRVEGNRIHFTEPLKYPIPKGTKILHRYNIFNTTGENITFQGLTLDLNKDEWPVRVIDHCNHCAFVGGGTNVKVVGCTVRNAWHRGVAWYGTKHGVVQGCVFENLADEAIDFDHYCVHCVAVDNEIRRCRVGVELNDPAFCTVARNRIEDCEIGINIWRWFKGEEWNAHNGIYENEILNSRRIGIHCGTETWLNEIVGNVVDGSGGVGIDLRGDRNVVVRNTVRRCGEHGILVMGRENLVCFNRCEENGQKGRGFEDICVKGPDNTVEGNECGKR